MVSTLVPVDKWTDAAGWDAFYRHELLRAELSDYADHRLKPARERIIVSNFERRPPGRQVLVVASGLSLMPFAIAELGQHARLRPSRRASHSLGLPRGQVDVVRGSLSCSSQ